MPSDGWQMPAKATVLDLQKSILAQLGQVAITGLTYRGSEPGLSSPLQDCATDTTMAPRFQISYEVVFINVRVKLPSGPRLQLNIRCSASQQRLQSPPLCKHTTSVHAYTCIGALNP